VAGTRGKEMISMSRTEAGNRKSRFVTIYCYRKIKAGAAYSARNSNFTQRNHIRRCLRQDYRELESSARGSTSFAEQSESGLDFATRANQLTFPVLIQDYEVN
jgi:hypothetical protein